MHVVAEFVREGLRKLALDRPRFGRLGLAGRLSRDREQVTSQSCGTAVSNLIDSECDGGQGHR